MTNGDVGILIVDDEFSVRDSLSNFFRKEGYRVGEAESGARALQRLQEAPWDLVLLDLRMPGMDGLELQERIKRVAPDIVIIVITAYASVETAVQALKEGAFDYVTKPIEPDLLAHLVRNAAEQRRLRAENLRLRAHIEGLAGREEIVGESPGMRRVLELVDAAARTDVPVLLRGDRGTGKAHVARAIHANSRRRYFPFVPVTCSPAAGLVERELFGQDPGAAPDAGYARTGRLGMADGGTLFLDEVGAVPVETQATLLTVLDSREFTRPGDGKPTRTDVRLICATTAALDDLAAGGRCREDFLYRIAVVTIELPPLAARREDVPLLAEHFLRKHAAELGRDVTGFDGDAMDLLGRYAWPGNVRELASVVERALVATRDPVIRAADLPAHLRRPAPVPGDSLAAMEQAHIARILARTGWDLVRAAEILQIDGAELRRRIDAHGLQA